MPDGREDWKIDSLIKYNFLEEILIEKGELKKFVGKLPYYDLSPFNFD